MPRNAVVARRYASALFQMDGENTSKIAHEFSLFLNVLENTPKGLDFFLSPVLSKEDKKSVLHDMKEFFPFTYRFLVTLVEADRMESFSEIVSEFFRMRDERSGDMSVELESARPLTAEALDDVRVFLQEKWKRNIKITTKVNSELIGGFIAKAPGRVLDASVSTQLESLRTQVVA